MRKKLQIKFSVILALVFFVFIILQNQTLAILNTKSVSTNKSINYTIEKTQISELLAKNLSFRTALVIGNADYQYDKSWSKLPTPTNDATDMGNVLKELGFDVDLVLNANKTKMENSIKVLKSKLSQGGVGLLYYSGHAVQIDGENYLIPIDTKSDGSQGISLNTVLEKMKEAKNPINILILDACRDYPASVRQGLASLDQASSDSGTFIAYATKPNHVATADEGRQRNAFYTASLLRYIRLPNLAIEELFKKVGESVQKETDGYQQPWVSSSLKTSFVFNINGKFSAIVTSYFKGDGAYLEVTPEQLTDPKAVDKYDGKLVKFQSYYQGTKNCQLNSVMYDVSIEGGICLNLGYPFLYNPIFIDQKEGSQMLELTSANQLMDKGLLPLGLVPLITIEGSAKKILARTGSHHLGFSDILQIEVHRLRLHPVENPNIPNIF